jgi:hypothetical protein
VSFVEAVICLFWHAKNLIKVKEVMQKSSLKRVAIINRFCMLAVATISLAYAAAAAN